MKRIIKLSILTMVLLTSFLTSCTKKSESSKKSESKSESSEEQLILVQKEKDEKPKSIAVFVPGICADSPIYAMLVEGVTAAVDMYNYEKPDASKAKLYVLEAGTNQAEWSTKLTTLAAQMKYDVIISSNPSLPDLAVPILEQFPNQKFIFLDATLKGNKNIYTVCYNQYEQAYLAGYIGGLMSKSHKMALIAAQEYPVMNNIILPYFEKGGKAANSKTTVDFRVVGNWYDANKGALLADAVLAKKVDVILPICGGAAQGVINSAVNKKAYITWFDNNGFSKAPGTIISSSVMKQTEMAAIVTENFLAGTTVWGEADMVGIKDGFVSFIQDDPLYIETVPEKIRDKVSALIDQIISGEFQVK